MHVCCNGYLKHFAYEIYICKQNIYNEELYYHNILMLEKQHDFFLTHLYSLTTKDTYGGTCVVNCFDVSFHTFNQKTFTTALCRFIYICV